MVALVNLPQYLPQPAMNLSPINDALERRNRAEWQVAQAAEDRRRWTEQNALAQGRFKLDQAQGQRAADAAPLQQELLKAQLEAARRSGASEAELAPIRAQMMRAQADLYTAQATAARQKDEMNGVIAGILRNSAPAPRPPPSDSSAPPSNGVDNPIRKQSMNEGAPPLTAPLYLPQQPTSPLMNLPRPNSMPTGQPTASASPMPSQGASGSPLAGLTQRAGAPGVTARDPNFILAQSGQGAGPPQQQPAQGSTGANMVRTPIGDMPMEQAQQFGFALGLAGKGDAGKIFIDAANESRLGKKASGEVEDQLINRISDLSDLQNIKTQFDQNPQMLELGSRLKATGLSWQAWLDSKSVSPEDRKFLGQYQRFRTATVERLNNRIKAFAGAAVSGQEKERMYAANPNEKDDPITFKAKLDEQINMQRAAIARYNWLRRQGLQPAQIKELATSGRVEAYTSLDGMKGIYDQRAQEIEQQLRQQRPNLQPQFYREMRNRQLKQEFGI